MITPTQCKAVIATLLALTLPGCGFQLPWASPSATSLNPSSERVAGLNHFPLDVDEPSITGSVLGDDAAQDKRAKKQASCDRRQAVSVGMTREQLDTSCWGKPTSISTSTIGANKFELLVYQGYDYVYLEDDVVKSVQVSNR
jgi:hypothetical protein